MIRSPTYIISDILEPSNLIIVIEEVSDTLQNMILQHSNINTFIRYYQVDIDVDIQGIIRKTGVSINPDRPFKLSPKESLSLNKLLVILMRQEKTIEVKERYDISIRDLRNKK
ncbi:uncharacterized protein N7483_010153 [Penicillium malachiteum]|uniref:uncharacterized protein n=1 Tax=Penicillium malachiteum TaxID=1324776 RepID=UPI0025477F54|nr:uncharacterized protein N7483_010153 [Penicillium malachiteum]KAJ5712972.1 hypothetical protein N7483_010153 [Penicillium malachiteum]